MSNIGNYDLISAAEQLSVCVPEHTDATRLKAAEVVADATCGDFSEAPKALATLAKSAELNKFARHATEPDDRCQCEDATWWCPFGDGEIRSFWTFDNRDLRQLEDDADAEAAAGGSLSGEPEEETK